MLKDILVVLEETDRAAIPYAISFAQRVEARLTALWPRRDLSLLADGSLEARHAAMRSDREARDAKARTALASFAAQARAAGLDAEALDYDAPHAVQPSDSPAFARGFDLVVVEQIEPGRPPSYNDLAGAILAESGRPVVVVPSIQRESARFDCIVAAWDGSQSAARAIGDAAPLLARAKHVEIVAANAAVLSQPVVNGGERIAQRFARLGVDASFRRLPGDGDVANLLLSHAADSSADMIVAGGYGHSRLREALMGGVTRTLLGSMTVPVFMSH
jgi:nucleotide-binding universal stress UspA family protein